MSTNVPNKVTCLTQFIQKSELLGFSFGGQRYTAVRTLNTVLFFYAVAMSIVSVIGFTEDAPLL